MSVLEGPLVLIMDTTRPESSKKRPEHAGTRSVSSPFCGGCLFSETKSMTVSEVPCPRSVKIGVSRGGVNA